MKTNTVIDPKRFYSLGEIVREGLIPRIDTIPKASRLVQSYQYAKVFKARMVVRGARGVQWKVRGQNIINYLDQNG